MYVIDDLLEFVHVLMIFLLLNPLMLYLHQFRVLFPLFPLL